MRWENAATDHLQRAEVREPASNDTPDGALWRIRLCQSPLAKRRDAWYPPNLTKLVILVNTWEVALSMRIASVEGISLSAIRVTLGSTSTAREKGARTMRTLIVIAVVVAFALPATAGSNPDCQVCIDFSGTAT
jgi:hypothetical protein